MGKLSESVRWAAVPLVVTGQAAALVPLLVGAVSLAVIGRVLAGAAQVLALAANATASAVAALLAGADWVNRQAGRGIVSSAAADLAAQAEVAESNRASAEADFPWPPGYDHDRSAAESRRINRMTKLGAALGAVAAMSQDTADWRTRRGPVPVEVTRAAVLAGDAVSFAAAGAAVRAERRRLEHLASLGYAIKRQRGDDGEGGL